MRYIILIILLLILTSAFAQNTEIRIKSSLKDVSYGFHIEEPNVDIEGYDGDEVIMRLIPMGQETIPEEAVGLKRIPITSRDQSKEFNILNPKVEENVQLAHVSITVPACNCGKIIIKVPKDPILGISPSVYGPKGRLFIKNIDNEVQVVGFFPVIELDHVAGFIFSTGGKNILPTNKIILSNIQWTDKPVMFNGALRRRNYDVGATSASIYLKIPADLNANLLYVSESGVISGGFSNRWSDEMMPTDMQMRQFTGDSKINPKLRIRKLNQGGDIYIDLHTYTGDIHFSVQDN